MRIEFLKRFDKSPVILEDDIIISLSGKIKLEGNTYVEQIEVINLSSDDMKSCKEDQKNLSKMMRELKKGFIQTRETFRWWINRY